MNFSIKCYISEFSKLHFQIHKKTKVNLITKKPYSWHTNFKGSKLVSLPQQPGSCLQNSVNNPCCKYDMEVRDKYANICVSSVCVCVHAHARVQYIGIIEDGSTDQNRHKNKNMHHEIEKQNKHKYKSIFYQFTLT